MPHTMQTRVAQARSLLFVPGNRPERFTKALQSGADAVVLDLEDSVPLVEKDAARKAIAEQWARLHSLNVPLVVRMNAVDSEAGSADLLWLSQIATAIAPAAVMVPKAESVQALEWVHRELQGVATLALIESAAGYAALPGLGAAAGLLRLVVGHIDFMADTGIQCDEQETQLTPLRFAVTMATCLHRLAPAVDGVTVHIGDEARLRDDAQRALRLGFAGKLCIHPAQIAPLHAAWLPGEQELAWAHKVLAADAAAGGAAVRVDGRMVDLPVVLQARRTLALAASSTSPSTPS